MWIRALQLHKHRNNVFFEKKKENKEEQTARMTKSLAVEVRGSGCRGGKLRLCLGHRAQHNHLLFWDSDRGHELMEEPLWELSKLSWGGGSPAWPGGPAGTALPEGQPV